MDRDIEFEKIRDRGMAMMDAIKAKHGEGEMFFRAMAVMVDQLQEHQDRKLSRKAT